MNTGRIIFVGIHNKQGKTPLDSSTMTGKVIDRIIAGLQVECIKTNLCEVENFPKDFADINEKAIAWHSKYEPTKADVVVTLGLWVKKHFWYDDLCVVSLTHPAGIYGTKNKDEYVLMAVKKINKILSNNITTL